LRIFKEKLIYIKNNIIRKLSQYLGRPDKKLLRAASSTQALVCPRHYINEMATHSLYEGAQTLVFQLVGKTQSVFEQYSHEDNRELEKIT
jgi:hypothetical protein